MTEVLLLLVALLLTLTCARHEGRIDTPLDDALTALRGEGSHLVAVLGEQGMVIGSVTMEDVLSEPVGSAPGRGRAAPARPGTRIRSESLPK